MGNDKVVFRSNQVVKKTLDYDDACIIMDSIDLLSFDCEQEVLFEGGFREGAYAG